MISLNWIKCGNDSWCSLNVVNLNNMHFNSLEGVYIIWHAGVNPKVVRVGQGDIKDRLFKHREDEEVQKYSNLGLFVTWARTSVVERDGIERYLGETLKPLVGSKFPDALPIEVNFPW